MHGNIVTMTPPPPNPLSVPGVAGPEGVRDGLVVGTFLL